MIVWFFWPQVFDLAANPINFTWVVCSRGSQGQIQVMQNDKGVSIKYLQEARRAFQYRANSNISAHALSWKRKEDATICGKDKSAQRNSTVFIKPSQSKIEGEQSMSIFSFFQMQMVLAPLLFDIFIHSLCSLINSRWLSNDIKVLKIVSFAHEKIIILGSRKEEMKKKRMHAVEESLIL